jgi:hypothetical protein
LKTGYADPKNAISKVLSNKQFIATLKSKNHTNDLQNVIATMQSQLSNAKDGWKNMPVEKQLTKQNTIENAYSVLLGKASIKKNNIE